MPGQWFNYYRSLGVKFPNGNATGEVKVLCPFHDDVNPSLSINLDTGLWYCHACLRGGTAREFKDALEEPGPSAPARPTDADVERWHKALMDNEELLVYLVGRGLKEETLVRFKIGHDGERYTIPIYEDGKLVNVRRYKPGASAGDKMKNWPGMGSPIRLWPRENLHGSEVLLCEGEWDCLVAMQEGLPAVTTTGGAGAWRSEWNSLFAGKKVYICYDVDEAGKEGVKKVADSLLSAATVYVVELQVKNGKDINDFYLEGGDLKSLLSTAKQYSSEGDIDSLLSALPEKANFAEYQAEFMRICSVLAKKSPVVQEHYIALIKQRFGIPKETIRKQIRSMDVLGKIEPSEPVPYDGPFGEQIDMAQGIENGVFHYGLYLPTKRGEPAPAVIKSDRTYVMGVPEGWKGPLPSVFMGRWSVGTKAEYGVFAWLGGKNPPSSREVFEDVKSIFDRFLWYPDPRMSVLLSVWTMATYVYTLFDSVAYLAMVGTKRTGKTRTMDVLEHLAFNAYKVLNATPASVVRLLDRSRCTLLLDEHDKLVGQSAGKDANLSEDLLNALRAGYKRPARVPRVVGESHELVTFDAYGPKAISNIMGLENALEDRTIYVKVGRKPLDVELEKLIWRKTKGECAAIRDKLYFFGLAYAQEIMKLYDEMNISGVEDREAEIFDGLFAVAKLVGDDIFKVMVEIAIENLKIKEQTDVEGTDAQFLQAVWDYVTEHEPLRCDEDGDRLYSSDEMRNYICSVLEWDHLSHKRMVTEMRKLSVIRPGKKRSRIRIGGRRVATYAINFDGLTGAMRKYGLSE